MLEGRKAPSPPARRYHPESPLQRMKKKKKTRRRRRRKGLGGGEGAGPRCPACPRNPPQPSLLSSPLPTKPSCPVQQQPPPPCFTGVLSIFKLGRSPPAVAPGPIRFLISAAIVMKDCSTLVAFLALVSRKGMLSESANSWRGGEGKGEENEKRETGFGPSAGRPRLAVGLRW